MAKFADLRLTLLERKYENMKNSSLIVKVIPVDE